MRSRGPRGKVSLLDLFDGRRQLIVYRAFFEPGVFGWPDHACRGCSHGGRPGRPRRAPERPRHHARLRLARAAGGYRAAEGADGLEDAVVHPHRQLRRRLRRGRMARHERVLSATATACSAPTSSTAAATSRWGAPGTTSTSRRWAGRRSGRISPEGYPQTPTYKWWNWHDSYVAGAGTRQEMGRGVGCRRGGVPEDR